MNSQAQKIHIFLSLLFVLLLNISECVIGPESYGQFISEDILLTDINHQILTTRVVPYLNVNQNDWNKSKNIYFGKIWGGSARPFVILPVKLNNKNCQKFINVIFLVHTGTPMSTLTQETLQNLYQKCSKVHKDQYSRANVQIAGIEQEVTQSRDHYKQLNILGGSFLRRNNALLEFNYFSDNFISEESVKIQFFPKQEVQEEL